MDLQTEIRLSKRLRQRLYPLTVLVWLLISLGFPAIFYFLEITALKRTATIHAQNLAEKFTDLVLQEPNLWKYQSHKYTQIIAQEIVETEQVSLRVLDERGMAIAHYEHNLQIDKLWWQSLDSRSTAPIKFNNRTLGTVEVTLSQDNLEKTTLAFFTLSITLGTGLGILIIFFPTKVVGSMEKQLQSLIKTLQEAKIHSEVLQALAQASEQRFRDLVHGLDAIVWEADAIAMQFSFISQRAEELLGYPVSKWLDQANFQETYIHPDDLAIVQSRYQVAVIMGQEEVVEYRAKTKDGREVWLRDLVQAVKDEAGNTKLLRGIIVDITHFKQIEKQLVHDTLHDVLTGLANRALLMQRLTNCFQKAKHHQDYQFAVLFLDLDRFKLVNDSLGHRIGDRLLIELSRRLEKCVRSSDTVARLGGDEFAILLDNIKDVNSATDIAERVKKELALPFNLSGHEMFAATSIGIAINNQGYDQPDHLLRDADTAMYYAKSQGKARHEIFDSNMHSQAIATLQLETDLRRAIERQELQIYYQPIVELKTAKIIGFEALLRWEHPDLGFVSPTEFIPIAEETGLIIPLGEWVMREACKQLHLWQVKFPNADITMSVNFSSKQFTSPNVVKSIKEILDAYNLQPNHIHLEITESVLVENSQQIDQTLKQLKSLGIILCLDDFGTGYSSLSYLHRFPIDILKIDRSFVLGMNNHDDDDNSKIKIIQTILALAANMGIEVVAEGVETKEQLMKLKALKCQYAQGYFFSKAVNTKAIEDLLAAQSQC
ncbi:putative bifunctional diguanylate cyclase/phosphodiesterase [Synechocystis sp. PCC 7509]|uniref:putative bifunctional diguanylate cyclase/phosphodiesterase n=1 Tax=Synechocystis sp. PCC 7509 TaxID=927677 RepID=UPI0002AC08BE|nr:EAL domain-containing protein [Synechocystis sp. PCC 7509]